MNEESFIYRLKWIGIAFLVVFPLLFLGGIHVGFISVRMVVAYGLLVYTLLRGETNYLPTRGMWMYYVYLAVYIIINMISEAAFSSEFIKELIAVHFVCCIVIYAFPRIFKSETSIQAAYLVLVFGFILDAIVTILQYQNSPIGWSIGMAINPLQLEDLDELQSKIKDISETTKSVIPGIMGRVTGNGYFIATMLPVMTYYIWDKTRFKIRTLWLLGMFGLGVMCIYYIQQRMALVVFITYLFSIILFKERVITKKLLLWMIIVMALAYFKDSILGFDYSQTGRLFDMEDVKRASTLSTLVDFNNNNPQFFWLGYNQIITPEDRELFLIIGHNTFTDALRLGGIFLLLTFTVLFFFLCKELIMIFFFSRREKDFRTMGFAIGSLCFLLYSQTHSTGVQSGSFMFWTLFMLTMQSHQVNCEAIDAEEKEEEEDRIIIPEVPN